MRTCPACGEELSYESEFCPGCGAETDFYMKPAGFWIRVVAYILDGLIFLPLAIFAFLNNFTLKNLYVALFLSVPSLLYKPLMEAYYGATLGKMICKIRVLDNDGKKLSIARAYVRFIPFMISIIIGGIISSVWTFSQPELAEIKSFMDLQYMPKNQIIDIFNTMAALFVLLDCIFAAFIHRKRAIHDMMAGSFCVKKPSAEQLQAARDISGPEGIQPGQQ